MYADANRKSHKWCGVPMLRFILFDQGLHCAKLNHFIKQLFKQLEMYSDGKGHISNRWQDDL